MQLCSRVFWVRGRPLTNVPRRSPPPLHIRPHGLCTGVTSRFLNPPQTSARFQASDDDAVPTGSADTALLHQVEDLVAPDGPGVEELQAQAGGMWLNQLGAQLWPWLKRALQDGAQGALPALLEAGRPGWMGGVQLVSAELGEVAPIVKSITVLEPDEKLAVEGVALDMDVEWASQAVLQLKVQPLPARLKQVLPEQLGATVNDLTSFQVGVNDFSMSAKVRVRLCPLKAAWPVVRSVQVSLLQTPDLDFNLTFSSGQSTWLNLVRPWLRRRLQAASAELLLPEAATLPLDETLGQPPITQEPVGVLLVKVLHGENLPVRQPFQSQPRVAVRGWLRHRCQRITSTVDLVDGSPVWPDNEAPLSLLVHSLEHQQLVLEHVEFDSALLGSSSAARSAGYLPLSLPSLQLTGTPCAVSVKMCDLGDEDIGAVAGQALAGSNAAEQEGASSSPCCSSAGSSLGQRVASAASATVATTLGVLTDTVPASASSEQPQPAQDSLLHTSLTYVSAAQAEHHQLHGSGILQLQIKRLWVPSHLPVPVHVTAALINPSHTTTHTSPELPTLSTYLLDTSPPQGNQREQQDQNKGSDAGAQGRWIPTTWDCVWDVIGPPGVLDTCKLQLGLTRSDTSEVASSFLEVKHVVSKVFPDWPGIQGGVYQVQPTGRAPGQPSVVWEVQLSWHPLVNTPAVNAVVEAGAGAEVQAAADLVKAALKKASSQS